MSSIGRNPRGSFSTFRTLDPMMFKRLVGTLMYLTMTRPDIMYGVSLISRFMDSPKDSHWQAGTRILRYVSGTKDLGIIYSTLKNFKLNGYTNNDNGGSIDDRKSTSGYTFILVQVLLRGLQRNNPY